MYQDLVHILKKRIEGYESMPLFFSKYLKFAPKKQITAVHPFCQFNEGVPTLLSQILSCLAPLVRDLRFHSQLVILI